MWSAPSGIHAFTLTTGEFDSLCFISDHSKYLPNLIRKKLFQQLWCDRVILFV